MPSSSTGHHDVGISREQPSSTGQLLTFSSGCKLNMKVDSEIEMESGSTFNVESGAYFVLNSGAYFSNENITTPTKVSTAISADGLTYFSSGGNYYLKTRQGAMKTLLSLTTEVVNVIAGTSLAAGRYGTSKECCLGITNAKAGKGMGIGVQLFGVGASTWSVITPSSGALTSIASASSSLAT